MLEEKKTRRGRPRDSRIDKRVIEATLELLAEKGFRGATIQAISRRAGIPASAIYRRWPSHIDLVEEATFPGFGNIDVKPTGNLRRDLGRFIDAYVDVFTTPAARTAIPGVISSYQQGEGTTSPEKWVENTGRQQFRAILEAAPADAVDPSVNADDVFDLLLGSVFYRTFVLPFTNRLYAPDHTVGMLCRALRPLETSEVPTRAKRALTKPR